MRLVLFGDGEWATNSLTKLWEAGHEILAVVLRRTPSEASLGELAKKEGVPVYVLVGSFGGCFQILESSGVRKPLQTNGTRWNASLPLQPGRDAFHRVPQSNSTASQHPVRIVLFAG